MNRILFKLYAIAFLLTATKSLNGQTVSFYVAGFNIARAIAFDKSDNLYVSDFDNSTISKISANGTISNFIKTGSNEGTGLAFDSSGYLYYINSANGGQIMKVGPDGTIELFKKLGWDFGPSGLTFDSKGNLFVTSGFGLISKITNSGVISAFIDSSRAIQLGDIGAIAFDKSDNLYLTNRTNNTIQKITNSGVISTFVNTGTNYASSLAFDAFGNLFASIGGKICKITTNGTISIFASNSGYLLSSGVLAFDSKGTLYCTSSGDEVLKVSNSGLITRYFKGLSYPSSMAFDDSSNLYVNSTSGINKITNNGILSLFANVPYYHPKSIVCDKLNNIYIVDPKHNDIQKITKNGTYSTYSSINLNNPNTLAIDNSGNLFVGNQGNHSIMKISNSGISSYFYYWADGDTAMVVDKLGNLYIANYFNNTISKISTTKKYSIIVDTGINKPISLAFDSKGFLYIGQDGYFQSIMKVSESGTVTKFFTDNWRVLKPMGLIFDKSDNLYCANYLYNNICKINNNNLPVSFVSFFSKVNENSIIIKWLTANELNTTHFIVQHSTDGSFYSDIGILKAIGFGANKYEFIDNNQANGINYYRLQSVDKDGSSSYSKVVSVNFSENQILSIAPNPAKDYANINFSKTAENASIAVFDITGKQVITQYLSGSTNVYKLNTQSLKSGLYVIKINTSTGNYNEKLLISK